MNHSFRGIELLLILLFSYFLVFYFWFLVGGFIPRSISKPSFISKKMKRKIFTKCKNKFEKNLYKRAQPMPERFRLVLLLNKRAIKIHIIASSIDQNFGNFLF
jgi:hypothetical protein